MRVPSPDRLFLLVSPHGPRLRLSYAPVSWPTYLLAYVTLLRYKLPTMPLSVGVIYIYGQQGRWGPHTSSRDVGFVSVPELLAVSDLVNHYTLSVPRYENAYWADKALCDSMNLHHHRVRGHGLGVGIRTWTGAR